ncbi:MAG TPA: hypothetical protein VFC31_12995 [Candidatus Limnocylindria bacterium]|nr:hypothetical protein [Candidatus Limnocylindria bacterium]
MRALTAAETAILKSRFQAGADGHRQQMKLTARVQVAMPPTPRNPDMPWAVKMPNGQAGLIFRADNNASGAADLRVFFIAYQTEHALSRPVQLFPYSTLAYGLVVWNAQLLAVCRDPSTGALRYRTSPDSGVTWTAEAALGSLTYAIGEVQWGGGASPSFQVTTDKVGAALYLFSKNSANNQLMYRTTSSSDPAQGWSALTYSGLTIPSLGRNYGGPSARNQGFQRAFVVCESKTPGTWGCACESDDGDWHANHMCTVGTLGGAWTRRLNAGYGGGLSGGQGANGMLFLDRLGDLLFYVISDNGDSATAYRSTDSGATWTSLGEQMPAGTVVGIGGGSGATVPQYDFQEYAWSHLAGGGVCLQVSALKATGSASTANLLRIFGVGASSTFKTYDTTTTDVSDRVIAISTQKDADLDAGSCNVELANVDGACNLHDPAAALYSYLRPNARIEIWQWHGDAANKVKTFTGILSQPQQSHAQQRVTLVALDRGKKLIKQTVVLSAPQDLSQPGYARDMGNYVYLNKTVNEVLDDLLNKAGLSPALDRAWYPSTYVFKELKFQSGSLMAAAKDAAKAAGLVLWADEDGIFRTAPLVTSPGASVWTFRAREDVTDLATEVDDDATYTRVRVIGKANLGAKYLSEQFVWPGLGAPAGIEYDKTTKTVWYLDYDRHLYRLDPAANMAVLEDTDLSAWLVWPDGMAVDPLDDHLWISDGFDASLGNNASRTYRKIDRTTKATLLGPFTNPDGDHCGIHAYDAGGGTVRLYMTTYTTGKLVRMNTDGTENSRVNSPVALPTAITSDGAGGYYLSAWDQSDLFQVAFDGSITNRIAQPQKNANEVGLVGDASVFDFGDLYQVFRDQNTIVKYAVAGTPSSAPTATLAEAVDSDLEDELSGERRYLQVVDLGITDLAMAQYTANRLLSAARQYRYRVTKGAVGHPGLQLHDRVTLSSPADGIASDWIVRAIRADQTAEAGTYLMVCVLEPAS